MKEYIEFCMECGNQLEKLNYGKRQCCNGFGYWCKIVPLSNDLWFPVDKNKNGYFLFRTAKCPTKFKPINQIEHDIKI